MNPLEALSPTIIAQLQHREAPTVAARAKYRGQVRREVLTCTDCELHHDDQHVAFSSPRDARFVVVGDAPHDDDVRREEPFRSPPAKLLRTLMRDVHIDPTDALYCNVVSCHPNTEGEYRGASKPETLACRSHLLAQVEAAYQPFVLLVGAKALDAFRSDLTLTDHHGQLFVWNDLYVVMCTFAPAAVLNGQTQYKALIREDLRRWHDVVYSGDSPLGWLGDECYKTKCKNDAQWWDRDGVPMCDKHWKEGKARWEKERYRWSERPVIQLTL